MFQSLKLPGAQIFSVCLAILITAELLSTPCVAKPVAILIPLHGYRSFSLGEIYHVATAVASAEPDNRPLILLDLRLGTEENPIQYDNVEDFLSAAERPDATSTERKAAALARNFVSFCEQGGIQTSLRFSRDGLAIQPIQLSTKVVAERFRSNLELGRGMARGALLGQAVDDDVRHLLRRRLGNSNRKSIGIFIRDRPEFGADRNMTPEILASLIKGVMTAGKSRESAPRILLLGDAPDGPRWQGILGRINNGEFGNRADDVVNLTAHWRDGVFTSTRKGVEVPGDLRKQLQFFVVLYEEFRMSGIIGPKSGMLDGASFVSSVPIIELARNALDYVDNSYEQLAAKARADSSRPEFANKVRGKGLEQFIEDRTYHYMAEVVDEESRMTEYSAATKRPTRRNSMSPDFMVEPFPDGGFDIRTVTDLLKALDQFDFQSITPVRSLGDSPCANVARRRR